jgi:aromatic ring-opening dioxygenase LigB subunit
MADFFEKLVPLHLQKNDSRIVKKVISEQLNEGNIIDFGKSLSKAIEEAKQEKGND